MINLIAIFRDKIFDRKPFYRNAKYIARYKKLATSFILDIVFAWAIVKIFDITWNYAFIKVFGILLLYEFLKELVSFSIDLLNYNLAIKNAMASEIRHYLSVFKKKVNWDAVCNYDDFLLESAFNKTLSTKLRVLAAINYGVITNIMASNPRFENRFYKVFCQIVPDFITKEE